MIAHQAGLEVTRWVWVRKPIEAGDAGLETERQKDPVQCQHIDVGSIAFNVPEARQWEL